MTATPPVDHAAASRLTREAGVPGGATPRRCWPLGSPGGRWCRCGTDAARSSAMGRPGSSAGWVKLPPKAASLQPARLAACLDRA